MKNPLNLAAYIGELVAYEIEGATPDIYVVSNHLDGVQRVSLTAWHEHNKYQTFTRKPHTFQTFQFDGDKQECESYASKLVSHLYHDLESSVTFAYYN